MKEIIEINAEDFEAAQKDPKVIEFLQQAKTYIEKLEAEGKNHVDLTNIA
jgi:predicted nuclease of restriction endonuclease-like (RecB) superfamily